MHKGRLPCLLFLTAAAGCGGPPSGDSAPPAGPAAALTRVDDEPPGANCERGGTAVRRGVDGDASGRLDDGEVERVEYHCHPEAPGPGPDPKALARAEAEPPGANCERGGVALLAGIDLDLDGQLDADEVDRTTYLCDGPAPPAPSLLSRAEPLAPGGECAFGGSVVHSGHDLDGDGALDDGEVEASTLACDDAATLRDVAAAASDKYSCSVKTNGTVWCWGGVGKGPSPVVGVRGVSALAAGTAHACALLDEGGSVLCWGGNDYGELGDGAAGGPARKVEGVPPSVAIAAGHGFTCALSAGGEVFCWGLDDAGQSGHGATAGRASPAAVPGLAGATALRAGRGHVCARKGDGSVWCWGGNEGGQLGARPEAERCQLYDNQPCRRHPTRVEGLPPSLSLDAYGASTCALTSGHEAWCWGANGDGQLGDGTTEGRHAPAPVAGLGKASEIVVGGHHACAVRADGSLACWGSNEFGSLGLGFLGPDQTSPQHALGNYGLSGLALGEWHGCALRDGITECWGYNRDGQVGPIWQPTPTEVLVGATKVDVGAEGACALRDDDSVWCWGAFNYGEFYGVWAPTPARKPDLPAAKDVSAGAQHACAVAVDGSVWCWGSNDAGELGVPLAPSQSTPLEVPGVDDATAIYAGGRQSCAVRQGGGLWCWGSDGQEFGQALAPREVLPSALSVALGYLHGCAVDGGHAAWCWGSNERGQVSGPLPHDEVAPLTKVLDGVAAVSAGYSRSCALRLDGSLWCWGNDLPAPAPVEAAGAAHVLEGAYWHDCVLRPDATAACRGMNNYGQLGDGTFDSHGDYAPVLGLTGVAQIAAGNQSTCARRADGSLWCWGSNHSGQLGDGSLSSRVTAPSPVTP